MYPQASNKSNLLFNCSKRQIPSIAQLESTAHSVFISRYSVDDDSFKKKIIKDIVYNEKSHVVAIFKDYLIYDDLTEFLKRYYTLDESNERLPKYFDYYETCSRIFPNYIILHEAKYIYKSIQKKQKMIDLQQQMELEMQKNEPFKDNNDKIFDTEVYNSIMNQTGAKDEELAAIFNMSSKMQGNKVENSFSSIDKIIDYIKDAEKSSEKIRAPVTNKDAIKYKSVLKKMLPNSHQRPNSQLKFKEKDDVQFSTFTGHCQTSRGVKNLKIGEKFQGSSKISEKKHMDILTERLDAFESNLILRKIKTRNKYQNEFGNMTDLLTSRLKGEYKKEFNLKHVGIFHSTTMLKDTQRSKTKTERSPDKARAKPQVKANPKKSNVVSVPKMTNNNIKNAAQTIDGTKHQYAHSVNSSALQIRTERGNDSPCKVQTARGKNMKIGFIMSDHNTLKPEIKSKKLNNIFNQAIGVNMSRNHNPHNNAAITSRNNNTKVLLKESQKKDELKQFNTLKEKKLMRAASALPAPKENGKMKFQFQIQRPVSSIGNINPDRTNSRRKQNSNLVYMNNLKKSSPSPIRQNNGFGTTSNSAKPPKNPIEYKIVSNSTKREFARPTISELLTQKEKQIKKIMEHNRKDHSKQKK